MFEKEKEKRKGPPRSYRLRFVLGAVLCGALLIAFVVSRWIGQVTAPYFTLVNFSISETENKIALDWRSIDTEILVTRDWTSVKQGNTISNLLGSTTNDMIKTLEFQTEGPALLSGLYNNVEVRLNGQSPTSMPRVYQAVFSSSGTWLAWIKSEDSKRILVTRIRQENGETITSLPSEPTYNIDLNNSIATSPNSIAISPDDTTLAVVWNSAEGMSVYITLIDLAREQLIKTFTMPPKGYISQVLFHPNGRELSIALDTTLYRLNIKTGEVEALTLAVGAQQFGYDSTGRWLAVMGSFDPTIAQVEKPYGLVIYDLTAETKTPPYYTLTLPPYMPVKFQFLKDGLVVGQRNDQLSFWEWTGESWDNTATWDVKWPQ